MIQVPDDVRQLLEDYLVLYESPENLQRLRHWEPKLTSQDQWHGLPRRDTFRQERAVPITVDIQNAFWLLLFPQDFEQAYREPVPYLRFHLQKRITQFRELADDTPLDCVIPIYMGTPFELSMFGVPAYYFSDRDPIIDQQPVIHGPGDLRLLDPPDLFSRGMMPDALRIFEGVREIAGDRFKVLFPEWLRGPFGLALYSRGYQDLLVDMKQDPAFAHALMESFNQARRRYFEERARYLGEGQVPAGSLFNDEVDSAVIGARHYREHIRPFEAAMATYHGRIAYWHSCGNTAPMAGEVARIGEIDLLDVSGWTDLGAVLPQLPREAPRLERRLHPLRDLQHASPSHMGEKVRETVRLCQEHDLPAITIRVSGLQLQSTTQADLEQVRTWIREARRAIAEEGSVGKARRAGEATIRQLRDGP